MLMFKNKLNGLRKNKKGGIEGLPLQLMIIVIVAALGTAVIIGWMGSIDTPKNIGEITVESGNIDLNETPSGDITVKITVTDQDGNPLEGALVSLSGCGIRTSGGGQVYGNTDRNGMVEFNDLTVTAGSGIRHVGVSVSKSDYGEKNNIKIAVIA